LGRLVFGVVTAFSVVLAKSEPWKHVDMSTMAAAAAMHIVSQSMTTPKACREIQVNNALC